MCLVDNSKFWNETEVGFSQATHGRTCVGVGISGVPSEKAFIHIVPKTAARSLDQTNCSSVQADNEDPETSPEV